MLGFQEFFVESRWVAKSGLRREIYNILKKGIIQMKPMGSPN